MPIVPRLEALRAIEDPQAKRLCTAEVHQLVSSQWRSDSRYRETMARHLVEDVHPMFRLGFESVLESSHAAGAVDVRAFSRINQTLHHHHSAEDSLWFPGFRGKHPELTPYIDILESEHAELVRLEARVHKGEMEALEQFCAELFDHLNREEIISVPHLMDGTAGF